MRDLCVMAKLGGDPPKKPKVADVCIQCVMMEAPVPVPVPVQVQMEVPVKEPVKEKNYELDEIVRILINLQV